MLAMVPILINHLESRVSYRYTFSKDLQLILEVVFQHICAVLEQNMPFFSYLLPLVSFPALRLEYTLFNSF